MKNFSPRIQEQISKVMEIIEALFTSHILGVYLYGSAVLGGLHINSDLDILIIVDQRLSMDTRKTLTQCLLSVSGRVGCQSRRPLEVTVMNRDDLIPWNFPPRCEYMYGEWMRTEMEDGQIPQAFYDPDLVILLWQVRGCSLSLKGPEANVLIEPISVEHVRRAIKEALPGLVAGAKGDERNVTLTLSRMWYTVINGKIVSKDGAADWAMDKLPQNLIPLLSSIRTSYLEKTDSDWSEEDMTALICFLKQSVESALIN